MSYNQIVADIKKRQFFPIYLLHGEEPFFIDEIAGLLENHVLKEQEKAFNLSILYGADVTDSQIKDAALRFPMMAPYQLIIVKEAQALEDFDMLEQYASKPNPTTILVLCHKHKKLAKTKITKAIDKTGIVFDSKKVYDNQLPEWILNRLKTKALKSDLNIAQLIADHLGNNLSKIANELDKLSLQLKPGSEITASDIQKHIGISKEYNVFEFQKALGHRDALKAYRIGMYFISNPKDNPLIMILAVLYAYFTKVYILIASKQKNEQALAKEIGLGNAFFLKDYKIAAQKYNRRKLEDIFAVLKEYDLKAKGVNANHLNNENMLKEVIFKVIH